MPDPRDERSAAGNRSTVPFSIEPDAPTPNALLPLFAPGQLIGGRYEVVRFVARGGMGEVYACHDRELGQRIALKTLRARAIGDPVERDRLKREILMARQVTHPNVCRLHDVGFHSAEPPLPFLTMELLAGETLETRIRRDGPMDTAGALPIVEQMTAALSAAHAAGVIHGDLKSQNVMVVDGRVVVTDFGLARTAAPTDEGVPLPQPRAPFGTPAYMSPEQIAGDAVTPAADLYALGVVMFELVTGSLPFSGNSPLEMAVKRLHAPVPSPRSLVPSLDPTWDMAIMRCLALRPADRFSDAAAVHRALVPSPETRDSLLSRDVGRARVAAGTPIRVKMLGPMTISRDGRALALPASRKVRALLAYLAVAPLPVSRSQLCDLLWDGPSDPRGDLRWCLSKIRGLIGGARVIARDDSLRIDLSDCDVDVLEIERSASAGIETLAPQRGRELAMLFGGDFLEGLDIDHSPGWCGWAIAQRRRFRGYHTALLEHLAGSVPEGDASGYLERWLELAPFDLRVHERLLGALARRGRIREGEEHVAAAVRLFDAEGLDGAPVREAWRSARARAAVSGRREKRGSPVPQADAEPYEYYQHGRQHLARMMRRGLEAGREMFVRAIELDAGYGPAWAGLAMVHANLHEWFGAGAAGVARVEHTSRRALEVAPRLAEAHVARALARSLSRHHDDAVREFDEAIRLNPYLYEGYYYFARVTFACGDVRRAAELFRLAAEVRQEDFQSAVLLGQSFRALGREDEAREAARAAIRRAEHALMLNPLDGRALSLAAGSLMDDGQTDRALEWADRAVELYPDDTSALANAACAHARAGQNENALRLIERVFARGCGSRDWVANDPDYDPLRQDPRFQQLLARLD